MWGVKIRRSWETRARRIDDWWISFTFLDCVLGISRIAMKQTKKSLIVQEIRNLVSQNSLGKPKMICQENLRNQVGLAIDRHDSAILFYYTSQIDVTRLVFRYCGPRGKSSHWSNEPIIPIASDSNLSHNTRQWMVPPQLLHLCVDFPKGKVYFHNRTGAQPDGDGTNELAMLGLA